MGYDKVTRPWLLGFYFVILAVSVALFFVDEIFRYIICSAVIIGLTIGALWALIPFNKQRKLLKASSAPSTPVGNNENEAIVIGATSPTGDGDTQGNGDIKENPEPIEEEKVDTQGKDDEMNDNLEFKPIVATKNNRKRLYWLDNLRVLLTAGVILHHIIVALGGIGWWYWQIGVYRHGFQIFTSTVLAINQSFGMCLFFFISGYFTPLSCDKRGRWEFIRVKFKKLGGPLVLWMYIFNPLMFYLSTVAVRHESNDFFIGMFKYGNFFSLYGAGPGWYIIWLLMFDLIYVSFGDNIPIFRMKFPSFKMLYFWAIIIGILQYFIVSLDTFIYLPLVFGSLYYDIIFFTCGVIAQRNNWLEYGINDMSRKKVWFIRILTPILVIIYIIVCVFDYVEQWGFLCLTDKVTDDCDDTNDSIDTPMWVWIIWYGFMGSMGITLAINSLQFCNEYLNWTNKITSWFARQSYTVYIIHPFILTPIAWSYVGIMVNNGANVPQFCEDSWRSKTNLGSDHHLWVGFIYTSILTYIVIWPIAWLVRQIPPLNYLL